MTWEDFTEANTQRMARTSKSQSCCGLVALFKPLTKQGCLIDFEVPKEPNETYEFEELLKGLLYVKVPHQCIGCFQEHVHYVDFFKTLVISPSYFTHKNGSIKTDPLEGSLGNLRQSYGKYLCATFLLHNIRNTFYWCRTIILSGGMSHLQQ